MAESERPLTPKQQRFVQEYLIDLNATAAAARAGYSDPNKGRQLVTKSNVACAIRDMQQARSERTQVTADRVLQELVRLAFFDPARLFDADGRLLAVPQMPEDARRAIVSFEQDAIFEMKPTGERGPRGGVKKAKTQVGVTTKVKWSKDPSIDKLCRHLGMYKDQLELSLKGPAFKVYMGFDPAEVVCPSPPEPKS